jgi:hypothetical protein
MYLKSDTIKATFGEDGGEKILHFLRNYIIPQEQSYCFYLRKGVRHFETATNSGHEGTNNAIKAGPTCVLPQHGIDKSVKIQVDTDSNRFDLYQRYMASALYGRATWSNSPTVNDITLPAEFMLKSAIDQCERYASWRTSPYQWLVVRSVDRNVHSLIPRFHRVYTVTSHEVDNNSLCLMCDCKHFECNGMVCAHMVHVKKYYASNPNISHHDVSVRWWKSYIYFAMKKESDCSATEKDIKQKLQSIRRNDCKGPNFIPKNDDHSFSPFHRVYKCGTSSNEQFTNATERTIGSLFRKASVLDRVINYTREEVEIALRNTKTTVPVSMSQEIYLPDEQVVDVNAGYDTDTFHAFHGNGTTTLAYDEADNIDDVLVESTTAESDCIDFGSRALPHEDVLNCHHYSAYDMIMARAKELVSLVDASRFRKDRGVIVEDALDQIISIEKANIASENQPMRGALVSGCPVGKVRKTNVSSWDY